MQFTIAAATILSMAGTPLAAWVGVQSNCTSKVYLTMTDASQSNTVSTIYPNGSFTRILTGMGNSWGLTKDPNYFVTSTPKLVFGYSVSSDNNTYYSVTNVDGNPFMGGPGVGGFVLGSEDASCPHPTSASNTIYTCPQKSGTFLSTLHFFGFMLANRQLDLTLYLC